MKELAVTASQALLASVVVFVIASRAFGELVISFDLDYSLLEGVGHRADNGGGTHRRSFEGHRVLAGWAGAWSAYCCARTCHLL